MSGEPERGGRVTAVDKCPTCGQPAATGRQCHAWLQVLYRKASGGSEGSEFICTEPFGHDGDHVAKHVKTGDELVRWEAHRS